MTRNGFAERYELDCGYCGWIAYASTRAEATRLQLAYTSDHQRLPCSSLTIYDRMAHSGAAQLWGRNGIILGTRNV